MPMPGMGNEAWRHTVTGPPLSDVRSLFKET